MDHGELSTRKTLCGGRQGILAAKQSSESMTGGAEQLERTPWWAWPHRCLLQRASWVAALKGVWAPFAPWWAVVQVKAQGKKQHMALGLVPWEAVSPSLSDCFIMYEAAMTSISRRHFNNNKPMSRSEDFDANNKQNL